MLPIRLPEQVICRPGATEELPSVAGSGRRIVAAVSPSAAASGLAGRIAELLERAGNTVVLHQLASGEPVLSGVDRLAEAFHNANAGLVVAVGGGSAIDSCKCACIIGRGEKAQDYFTGRRMVSGPGIPMIAVPTTFGTGAEVTPNAVISDPIGMIKQSVRSPFMLPAAAVTDCENAASCPASVAADSGMDALVQAIEAAVSRKADDFSRPLAVRAAEMLFANLERFAADRSSPAAAMVAEASLLAGIALAHSGLGAVHGLAHPLGIRTRLPHGRCCALLMREVMRRNELRKPGVYDAIPDAAGRFAGVFNALYGNVGLSDFGADSGAFPEIVANSRSGSMKSNPVDFTDHELIGILEESL